MSVRYLSEILRSRFVLPSYILLGMEERIHNAVAGINEQNVRLRSEQLNDHARVASVLKNDFPVCRLNEHVLNLFSPDALEDVNGIFFRPMNLAAEEEIVR